MHKTKIYLKKKILIGTAIFLSALLLYPISSGYAYEIAKASNENDAHYEYFIDSYHFNTINPEKKIKSEPQTEIIIRGGLLLRIILKSTSEVPYKIWINWTCPLKSKFIPSESPFFHYYTEGINQAFWFAARVPYRFSLGTFEATVHAGEERRTVSGVMFSAGVFVSGYIILEK